MKRLLYLRIYLTPTFFGYSTQEGALKLESSTVLSILPHTLTYTHLTSWMTVSLWAPSWIPTWNSTPEQECNVCIVLGGGGRKEKESFNDASHEEGSHCQETSSRSPYSTMGTCTFLLFF